MKAIRRALCRLFGHDWYRAPDRDYVRTCQRCGRYEGLFQDAFTMRTEWRNLNDEIQIRKLP